MNKGEGTKKVGDAIKGVGCLIILIPIAIILIMVIWSVLF